MNKGVAYALGLLTWPLSLVLGHALGRALFNTHVLSIYPKES